MSIRLHCHALWPLLIVQHSVQPHDGRRRGQHLQTSAGGVADRAIASSVFDRVLQSIPANIDLLLEREVSRL